MGGAYAMAVRQAVSSHRVSTLSTLAGYSHGAGLIFRHHRGERPSDGGVELGSGFLAEHLERLTGGQGAAVRPVVRHRVIGVDDCEDPSGKGNPFSTEPS